MNVRLLHELIAAHAKTNPDAQALVHGTNILSYTQLWDQLDNFAETICGLGVLPGERVAIYLPKQVEAVVAMFGAAASGAAFVPVNPLLKARQVGYILKNCNVRMLVTSGERLDQLAEVIPELHDLQVIILVSPAKKSPEGFHGLIVDWGELLQMERKPCHYRTESDMVAILYTSGSTGLPKGVVLSHRNMVAGGQSSADQFNVTCEDRLLGLLPLSFDYGFVQLSSAFSVGACVVLMDFLFPRSVVSMIAKEKITALSAVPPIWNQLAALDWPEGATQPLRYITSSGGAMPQATLAKLQEKLTTTSIYLMYGLTEAFRSTYLQADEVNERPDSVGKAIPNAEVMVVREDGSICAPGEPGELVHRGPLVAMGYWNDPNRTAARFKPSPTQPEGIPLPEIAVWSGDQMRMDEEGYLYFVSRKDEMIKTSGYRVSPVEVEEIIFASGLAVEVVAFGVPHPALGQAIVLIVQPVESKEVDQQAVLAVCQCEMPTYMIPAHIALRSDLPRNPNGKIDRPALKNEYQDVFKV